MKDSCLTRAVGPHQHGYGMIAKFKVVDGDGLHSAKSLPHFSQLESVHSNRNSPATPCGRNLKIKMIASPFRICRRLAATESETASKRRASGRSRTSAHPNTGPRKLPAPPTMSIDRTEMDSASVKLVGSMY